MADATGVAAAREVLAEVFGYAEFRPGQAEAIEAALSGRDAVVVLPTGSGKSICYQTPALVGGREGRGTTLVISPLLRRRSSPRRRPKNWQRLISRSLSNLQSSRKTRSAWSLLIRRSMMNLTRLRRRLNPHR